MISKLKKNILLHTCCAPCACYVVELLKNDYSIVMFFFNPNIEPQEEFSIRLNELKRFSSKNNIKLMIEDDYENSSNNSNAIDSENEIDSHIEVVFENKKHRESEKYEKDNKEQKYDKIKKIDKQYFNNTNYKSDWLNYVSKFKAVDNDIEGGDRCKLCYRFRIMKTALTAKKHNFDLFGTVLSISPHKNSVEINSIGTNISEEVKIPFLTVDFKKNDGFKKSCILSRKYNFYRQKYCGCLYYAKKN